jgi:amidase
MRGCSTNGSYVALIGKEPYGNVHLNDTLWEAGAVFYARMTQPQAVMHLETSTNIYGVTVNPWNTDLTPGGSSGGESALVAMRGSVFVSEKSRVQVKIWLIINRE